MLKTYRIISFTLFLFVLTLTTASSGFTPAIERSVHDAACGEDQGEQYLWLRGGKNPTCWKNLAISLQAQLDARPKPVVTTPSAPTTPAPPNCKVDTTNWMLLTNFDNAKAQWTRCTTTLCKRLTTGQPVGQSVCR